jgi:hypothetical protein
VQDELEVAKAMLSVAEVIRKAAKVADVAGVADSAKAMLATRHSCSEIVCTQIQ